MQTWNANILVAGVRTRVSGTFESTSKAIRTNWHGAASKTERNVLPGVVSHFRKKTA